MEGLINKYKLEKTNGNPIDPNAKYFVLRYDAGQKDKKHGAACRKALYKYALEIADHLPELSKDLVNALADESHNEHWEKSKPQ